MEPVRPRPRLDHVLLLVAAVVMSVGAVLPWIRGSTLYIGNISWTGLDDAGDGAILIGAGLLLAGWVRWRSILEEIDPRTRWIPLVVAIACALLWFVALRKVMSLSWFETEAGARPQIGLLVAGLGVVIAIAGGWLATRTRAASSD